MWSREFTREAKAAAMAFEGLRRLVEILERETWLPAGMRDDLLGRARRALGELDISFVSAWLREDVRDVLPEP